MLTPFKITYQRKTMKRKFLTFAMLLAVMTFSLTSCLGEDETCFCVIDGEDGETTEEIDPEDYDTKNCTSLTLKLNLQAYNSDNAYVCFENYED